MAQRKIFYKVYYCDIVPAVTIVCMRCAGSSKTQDGITQVLEIWLTCSTI